MVAHHEHVKRSNILLSSGWAAPHSLRSCAALLLVCIFTQSSLGQGLPAVEGGIVNIPNLTKATVEGDLMRVGPNGQMDVKTEQGVVQLLPVPAQSRASGLTTSISIQGTGKLEWLKKGMPIYLEGIADSKNNISEPVEELVIFAPQRNTKWGIEETIDQPEDPKLKSISFTGRIVKVQFQENEEEAKEAKELLVSYVSRGGRSIKKSVPINNDTVVTLNSSDIRLAQPGDSVSATGYVVREPMVMALNVTITKESGQKPKVDRVEPEKQMGPDQSDPKNEPTKEIDKAKDKVEPAKKGRVKRLRLRAGRTIIVNW